MGELHCKVRDFLPASKRAEPESRVMKIPTRACTSPTTLPSGAQLVSTKFTPQRIQLSHQHSLSAFWNVGPLVQNHQHYSLHLIPALNGIVLIPREIKKYRIPFCTTQGPRFLDMKPQSCSPPPGTAAKTLLIHSSEPPHKDVKIH